VESLISSESFTSDEFDTEPVFSPSSSNSGITISSSSLNRLKPLTTRLSLISDNSSSAITISSL
jgi:hypothetical protein